MSTHLKALTRRIKNPVLPVFPLSGTVVLPGCELPLNIFEPRYLNMVDDALRGDRLIGMVQPVHALTGETPKDSARPALATVGTVGRIKQFSETDDGRYMIALIGMKRFSVMGEADVSTPYRQCNVSYERFEADADIHDSRLQSKSLTEDPAERARMTAAMKSFAKALGVDVDWDALSTIPMDNLVDQSAMISPFTPFDKQSLLEAQGPQERRKLLVGLMNMYANPNNDPRPKPGKAAKPSGEKGPNNKLQ